MPIATLSFDDGGACDLPVLEMLRKRGIPATFYLVVDRVSSMNPRHYDGFEVGSHTVTHPKMCEILPERRIYEIVESRKWLASFIGKAPVGIAWPGGGFEVHCGEYAQAAGYLYGRGFYITPGPQHTFVPWNHGITFKFNDQAWQPTGEDAHLVAHPAAMSLPAFEQTLQLMLDAGYSFVTNAEFYHVL